MKKIILLLPALIFITGSCDQPRFNFDHGVVPLEVVNLREINSGYDDYNSAGPRYFSDDLFSLVFSSNRNSNGEDFDLVGYFCMADVQDVMGTFTFQTEPSEFPMLDTVNTASNEFGPYMTRDPYDYDRRSWMTERTGRLYYASDSTGDLDICYLEYDMANGFQILDTGKVSGLNSTSDDGYLCLHTADSLSGETAYFTSDRDGSFDIFLAEGETAMIATSTTFEVSKVDILSGPADDKCPYIIHDMLVFTSDRTGGFGGFDLWYSTWDGTAWTAPVNFGEEINTEYNEYRPIIIPSSDGSLLNDILFFSSDRPGGKGGYDLYYTGMKRRQDYF